MDIDTSVNVKDISTDPSAQPQEGHQHQASNPSQEGQPLQEGPLAWFLEYFGHLNAVMEQIVQRKEFHGTYIERIRDNYER